jgi:UDP-N-acetylglucosamine diphosphorylase / glucose-1-phosphate thymidylyltransferase / UDP-N-acetylgalactosamine diphosphorylase / glucosamine-1-phosphate N-acetyltransferase / galactosamine-1-phosphate N-acetyltransferase
MKRKLTAVILAGGAGKRFWPLKTDKILLPFLGKPLIAHTVIDALPPEVTDAVVIANPQNSKALAEMTFGVPHTVVVQNEAKGMADALMTARNILTDTSLLVMIADHFVEKKLITQIVKKGRSSSAFGVMPGWKPAGYFPGGYFELDGTRIKGIVEKPEKGKEPSGYVNVTGHYISDANVLFAEMEKTGGEYDDRYERALTQLMSHTEFTMVPYDGYSSSLKLPWNILDMTETLLSRHAVKHIGRQTVIKDNVVIDGPVWIGDNVRIFENTKIIGPAYIGSHTIIGNNNIIRGSYIGQHCVTGFNTDITRSYIGANSWFHSNYIGDSVIEENVSMGSGAVLANLRLDDGEISSVVRNARIMTGRHKLGAVIGKHVRIGVNASIMPGVKIGSGSFIGAGVVLSQDLPEKSFTSVRQEHVIVANLKDMETSDRDEFLRRIM